MTRIQRTIYRTAAVAGGFAWANLLLVPFALGDAPAAKRDKSQSRPAARSDRVAKPQPKPAGVAQRQTVAVPAYFYPAGENLAYWEQLRRSYPSVRMAVATGLGLEGTKPDGSYQAEIAKTRKVGILVLAYVTTSSGNKPLAALKREIDNAYSWYGADGIFFDESVAYPVTGKQVGYYTELHKYVKTKGGRAITVINHGQILPEEYAAVADIMMNAEMSYESYVNEWRPWGWESRYPAEKFWHLIHGVDTAERMREVIKLSRTRNAGYVFITSVKSSSPGGPYGSLPPDPYWSQMLKEVTSGSQPKRVQTTAPAKAATAPTILAAKVKPEVVAPGKPFKLTFHWQGVPLDRDYAVFVHFVGSNGATLFQGDHVPPIATTKWSGPIRYTRTINVPATAPEGTYKIIAGLYAALPDRAGWQNLALQTGTGVVAVGKHSRYQVGTVKFDRQAPPPPLDSVGPVTLNLKGYKRTFSEEFNDLSVSAWGPNTRWIAHTPYAGDFGDARFADPVEGFPFTIHNGMLRIEARKDAGGWKSGLLSSVDPKGHGFSQTYGYFEMRAKFPKGPGTWPAFWMLSLDKLRDRKRTGIEIDIVEQYGHASQSLHAALHWWPEKHEAHRAVGEHLIVDDMTEGFHKYGLLWNKDHLIWYFDGVELWRQPTPPEAHTPMYLLVNLALGGGWPIDQTPNPSYMLVDYVRAYAEEGIGSGKKQPKVTNQTSSGGASR